MARPAKPAMADKPKCSTREERAANIRLKIFEAAGIVVGEVGYADTTIGRIVEQADIAQGTFYLYFQSRQALFDELLPHFGQRLVAYVRGEVAGAPPTSLKLKSAVLSRPSIFCATTAVSTASLTRLKSPRHSRTKTHERADRALRALHAARRRTRADQTI